MRLEAGGWRLEAQGSRLEAGGWTLEAGGRGLEAEGRRPSVSSFSQREKEKDPDALRIGFDEQEITRRAFTCSFSFNAQRIIRKRGNDDL